MRARKCAADSSTRFVTAYHDFSPTLTRSRAAGFWLTSHRRRLTPAEQFRLMGFNPEDITPVKSGLCMGRLAGNAMAVPILEHLFEALVPQLFPQLSD